MLLESVDSRLARLPVLRRRTTRATDCANYLAIDDDRKSDFDRHSPLEREDAQTFTTRRQDILKCFRWAAEKRG